MDPLSDVLALLRPRDFHTGGLDAGGAWTIRFDNEPGRIKSYAVTGGTCLLAVDGEEGWTRLAAGDCFVVPSGCSFMLASDPNAAGAIPAAEVFARARYGDVVTLGGGGGFALVGTRFEVDGLRARALLGALPPVIHVEAAGDQAALRGWIERIMLELRGGRPGAALAAHHLAQFVLLQALRLYLDREGGGRVGWLYALTDPQLARALSAIHAEPSRCWTLGGLAACAGLSRSVFAQRFRERVGETPIAYLVRWRMMLASEQLATSRDTVSRVATGLGYRSETAFNTAFRRVMGCSPRRYVRPHAQTSTRTAYPIDQLRGPHRERPRSG